MPHPCPHRQVAASRVTEHRGMRQIEPVLRGDGAEVVDRVTDVEVCARPPASRLTDAAVLNVPAGDAIFLESSPIAARYLAA